jgi:hypothetical protein
MPTLQKLFYLEITPEKFVDNCSEVELQEVILLANKKLSWLGTPPAHVDAEELPKPRSRREPSKSQAGATATKKRMSWTPEEDATLRSLWPALSGREIAEKPNREYKSVMFHAGGLGLKKNKSQKRVNIRQQPSPPAIPPALPKSKRKKEEKDSVGSNSLNLYEEQLNERARALRALKKAKDAEAGGKMVTVRVDKRTTVLVPEGTDIERIKDRYKV